MSIHIRLANEADLPSINSIYNHYVSTSTCTYQEEPTTEDERRTWFANRSGKHPVTVAVMEVGEIAGFGALNEFRARSAYRFTVENSVYVRHDLHRQGLGRMLLVDLLDRAKEL